MIVTFYSFKGGVGRSHLLVETAVQLASRGRSVLVWDLDLEAPGIQKLPDLEKVDARLELGTLDLLEAFQENEFEFDPQLLREAIIPFDAQLALRAARVHARLHDRVPRFGRLDFLLPGKFDDEYAARFAKIPWGKLFDPEPGIGQAFFQRIANLTNGYASGDGPKAADDSLTYEFVLIDARTGFTDLGGVSLYQLPDLAVVVFNLNEQNLAGARRACLALARAKESVGREIPVCRVANMVPDVSRRSSELAILRDRKLEKLVADGLPADIIVPLQPELLLTDSIPSLGKQEKIANAIRPLVESIEGRDQVLRSLRSREVESKLSRAKALGREDELDEMRRRGIFERAKTFEEQVGDLFRMLGYQVTVDYKLDDRQYDLKLAAQGAVESHLLVECKDLGAKVGIREIEDFAQKVRYAVDRDRVNYQGMLVSRSGFVNNAHEVARVKLMMLRTYDELLLSLVDMGPNIDSAIRGFEGTPLESLYVEQQVVLQAQVRPGEEIPRRPLTDSVLEWMEKPGSGVLTLLGDFGSGKSAFTRRLACTLAKRVRKGGGSSRIPVLIDLREGRSATVSLENLLTHHFQKLSSKPFNPQAFLHLNREGHVLLIFDGFDEVIGYAEPVRYVEILSQLLRAAEGRAKVILTCRTHYFRDRPEELTSFKAPAVLSTPGSTQLYEALTGRSDVEIAYLLEFDDARIDRYLQRAFPPPADWTAARAQIDATYNLRNLSERPFLLDIITQTLPQFVGKKRSVTIWDLYETYCEKWFEVNDLRLTLTRGIREALVERLARLCWDAPGNRIHHASLVEQTIDLLDGRPLGYLDKERLDYEIRTATFLVRDAEGNYAFVHRSFLEFFVARTLRSGLLAGDAAYLDIGRITPEVAFFLHFTEAAERIPGVCGAILEAPYRARVSENALLLLYQHARSRCGELVGPKAAEVRPEAVRKSFESLRPEKRIHLERAVLTSASLPGIDLSGAQMIGARLDGSDLSHAVLRKADLREARLSDANLQHADLDEASLRLVSGDHLQAPRASLRGADLSRAELSFARFTGADLTRARLAVERATGTGFLNAVGVNDDDLTGLEPTIGRSRPEQLTLRLQVGHSGGVNSVAWSPDGAQFASSGSDGTVRVWDARAERVLRVLEGHVGGVTDVAFSPDGRQLASSGNDGSVRVWDARAGQVLRVLEGHVGGVTSVAFSPDGAQLASSGSDGSVRVWDARSGKLLRVLEGHDGQVWSVAWSPDGAQLASSGGDGSMRVWDARAGQVLRVLRGHRGRQVWNVAFSPDGAQLASSGQDDAGVRVWDARAGKVLRVLEGRGRRRRSWSVAWSPDGAQIASPGANGSVRVWDACAGKTLHVLEDHGGRIRKVAFSPDGAQLATCGDDGSMRVWDACAGKLLRVLPGHGGWVWSVAWSPDGAQLASSGDDGQVRVWGARTGKVLRVLEGHRGRVRVTWSPDGTQLASSGSDGSVRLWDTRAGKLLRVLDRHVGGVTSVAFSADGARLASSGDDGCVRVWDARAGKLLRLLSDQSDWIWSVAWSPDGAQLASCGDDTSVRVWDVRTGKVLREFEGHIGWVWSVAWSPDGSQLASSGTDGSVRVWDVRAGKLPRVLEGHVGRVWAVAWSPDGLQLASAGHDGSVRVWDARAGKVLRILDGHGGGLLSVAWSPDGGQLAIGAALGAASMSSVEETAAPVYFIATKDQGEVLLDMGPGGCVAGDARALDAFVRFGDGWALYPPSDVPERCDREAILRRLAAATSATASAKVGTARPRTSKKTKRRSKPSKS